MTVDLVVKAFAVEAWEQSSFPDRVIFLEISTFRSNHRRTESATLDRTGLNNAPPNFNTLWDVLVVSTGAVLGYRLQKSFRSNDGNIACRLEVVVER